MPYRQEIAEIELSYAIFLTTCRVGAFSLVTTFLLTILKLNGLVNWNWLFILSPLWLPVAILFATIITTILLNWSKES